MPSAEYQREWRKRNPGKYSLYCKKWKSENHELALSITRQWKEDNKEYAKDYRLSYYQDNKEKMVKSQSARRQAFPVKALLINAKSRAKKRGIDFNIKAEDLEPFPTHCPVSKVKLIYVAKGKLQPNSASLDRFDNTKGYIKGNVCIISHRANMLKRDASVAEVEAILRYMKNGIA